MVEQTRHTSFDLVEDFVTGQYALFASRVLVKMGTLKEIATIMVQKHGINIEEIEFALETMCKNEHDRANFGEYGTFIYSTNDSVDNKIKTA